MDRRPEARLALVVILVHCALLTAGFLILVEAFAFPDILRAGAAERLALFTQNAGQIIPAYYLMGLSGITQIAIAVLVHRALKGEGSTLLLAALVAGILGGAFQAMGFLRWPIAIPYLAEQMAAAPTPEARAMVALAEGLLNRYAGMVVGEHLGFLGQGGWTILIAIAAFRARALSSVYGAVGIVLGLLILGGALEQLGGPFEAIGMVSTPATAAWMGWLIMIGVSLARADANGYGPRFSWASAAALASLMGGLVAVSIG